MAPIFLLGSAIYLVRDPANLSVQKHSSLWRLIQGLRLTQMNLSHERYMEQAEARIKALEDDITTLEASRRAAEATPSPGDAPKTEQPHSKWRLF